MFPRFNSADALFACIPRTASRHSRHRRSSANMRLSPRRASRFFASFDRSCLYVSSASGRRFSRDNVVARPRIAGAYVGSSRTASSYRPRAASCAFALASASPFITRLTGVSGCRTGGRGTGRGASARIAAAATATGTGGGGGAVRGGGGGGAAAKLNAISDCGPGFGLGIALGTYTRSPDSRPGATERLDAFVRSRIGRRPTHHPSCAAPYRKRRKGTVEKSVDTSPFCRTNRTYVAEPPSFRNTRDQFARASHIVGSTSRVRESGAAREADETVTLFLRTDDVGRPRELV